MTPFPLNLQSLLLPIGTYAIFLLIGFAFGYALEVAGFGNSPKLAAQFYLKEMTVLKVMFTAIIVAMVGIFLASSLGLLDYNLVWVNPTYLWPGIVGGLIMGFGFILGGFCPGTSLVAVATAKIDGVFFVLGVIFGIIVFGETVQNFDIFFNSSYMGRFTLMDWLDISTGWVVILVVLMALFMFWGGEQLEKIFGNMDPKKAPKQRYYGAAALLAVAVLVFAIGQPTNQAKWEDMVSDTDVEQRLVEDRAYQIHPGEVLDLMHRDDIQLFLIDLRSEADYNLFHLDGAKHIPFDQLLSNIPNFLLEPSNAVFLLYSNDEDLATEAWKMMIAEKVHNTYMLEGGVNYWLNVFTADPHAEVVYAPNTGETLQHEFSAALGAMHPAAKPDAHIFELDFVPKVKLELKKGPTGGGCG